MNPKWGFFVMLTFLALIFMKPAGPNPSPQFTPTVVSIKFSDAARKSPPCTYGDPEKIQSILNAFRLAGQSTDAPHKPIDHLGSQAEITLLFSDGSKKAYRLYCGRYLQFPDGHMEAVKESRVRRLLTLLQPE